MSLDSERLRTHPVTAWISEHGGYCRSRKAIARRCIHPLSPICCRRHQPARRCHGRRWTFVGAGTNYGCLPLGACSHTRCLSRNPRQINTSRHSKRGQRRIPNRNLNTSPGTERCHATTNWNVIRTASKLCPPCYNSQNSPLPLSKEDDHGRWNPRGPHRLVRLHLTFLLHRPGQARQSCRVSFNQRLPQSLLPAARRPCGG